MPVAGYTAVGTVVIGAGQARLATGYHLARRNQDFVVLDAAPAVGASWRDRWDSLRLFTPAGFTHLPGLPFPAGGTDHPGKDAAADYLAGYAERFALPVALRTRVEPCTATARSCWSSREHAVGGPAPWCWPVTFSGDWRGF